MFQAAACTKKIGYQHCGLMNTGIEAVSMLWLALAIVKDVA